MSPKMKTSQDRTTKASFEILKNYLNERRDKWLRILNEDYKTDGGGSLAEHSKGRLSAVIEFISFIEALEKQNEE